MTPERWHRVTEIFHAALEQPEERRKDFLLEACGGDASMLEEVRRMLGEAASHYTRSSNRATEVSDHASLSPVHGS